MFNEKPTRELLEHQIDFDIIPSDVFQCPEAFNMKFDGKLHVNGECYKCLVIPYAQFITEAVAKFAVNASKAGFEVIFVNQFPQGICGISSEDSKHLIEILGLCKTVKLESLAAYLLEKNSIFLLPNFNIQIVIF